MIDALIKLWELGYERVCIKFLQANWDFCGGGLYSDLYDQYEKDGREKYAFMPSVEADLSIEVQEDFGRLAMRIFDKYPFPDDLKTDVGKKHRKENRAIYLEQILAQVEK